MGGTLGRPGNLQTTFGEVVRAWREARNLSLTEFAGLAGLQKGYVSEVEHGKIASPRAETQKKLATALGITEWDLHTRRMPPNATIDITTRSARPVPGDADREIQSATGALPSPVSVSGPDSLSGATSFGAELEQIVAEFNLPYVKRKQAQQMIRETARAICKVIKDENN